MTRDIKKAVGRPDNSVFVKRCIIYGIVLAAMLFAAPSLFEKLLAGAAVQGILSAWYAVFVPITAIVMAIGLFKCWRRRWSMAYLDNYRRKAKENGYKTCPRCGADIAVRTRQVSYNRKVGERHITTTHSDGSQTTHVEDITRRDTRTEEYYICANGSCGLEPDKRYSQSHLPWKISEIRALVRSEGGTSGKIGSPRSSKSASTLLLSRLKTPIIVALLVVVGVVLIMNYASWYDGEWTYVTLDKQSDRSVEEYQDYLLSLDTEYFSWSVTYEKSPTTMLNYLAKFIKRGKMESYTLGGYNAEGGNIYDYRFEGDDAGTGIPDGRYTLTTLDGIHVLMDEDNKTIYKEGTAFYDTYAPKLLELTHDQAVAAVLEKTSGGEHGIYNGSVPLEFILKDNSMVFSYLYTDDTTYGNEFRAITTYPEEQMEERWFFYYRTSDYYPDDWEGFVYADDNAFNTDDELGKLMQKSFDDCGGVAFYKNGEVVLGISIDYYPNGYDFEIAVAEEGYERGFEEDMVYRINTTEKTLTKYVDDYGDLVDGTDMPLSEYQEQYDFLLSIVPHTYIRYIIDMEKAEKRKESAGLVTVYEMKDENGNVTADMKLMFGKIGEVNHYTGENEYVQIELEY